MIVSSHLVYDLYGSAPKYYHIRATTASMYLYFMLSVFFFVVSKHQECKGIDTLSVQNWLKLWGRHADPLRNWSTSTLQLKSNDFFLQLFNWDIRSRSYCILRQYMSLKSGYTWRDHCYFFLNFHVIEERLHCRFPEAFLFQSLVLNWKYEKPKISLLLSVCLVKNLIEIILMCIWCRSTFQ